MSNTYTVLVSIDQNHVKQYNTQGYKLCFAAGLTDSPNTSVDDAKFNVIAYTQNCAATVEITWQESYAIAATSSSFMNGVRFVAATAIQAIKFGQCYEQPADWTNGNTNSDPNAPKAGFSFINKTKAAAAVVYKKVQGAWAPIYVSQKAPLAPGTEMLVPKVCCAIWFAADADTSNMISTFATNPIKLDLTGNSSGKAQVTYNRDEPSPINTISWTDEYHMAACKNGIERGSYASPNTLPQLVKPNDTYSINEGWEATKTTPNPAAATSSSSEAEILPIRFANCRRASAMLFKRVRNRVSPAFILSLGTWPLERGRYDIVPTGTMILFFAAAEPSTAFELNEVPMAYYELDYTKSLQADVVYTAEGD
ncbi:MAG: hypothetical protein M1828_006399 [Chrysothrix sp. TS-e1954]|nr:MAG: hypothetical protein M1828_006399 [Chrysothrix sp. TS-e1954]